jgi:tetratricopeptide (TPR) repeat protein
MSLALNDPPSLDTLGVVYAQLQAHAKAAAAFARAVSLDPCRAGYRLNLATALLSLGDVGQARRELERCIDTDPHLWSAHLRLAEMPGLPDAPSRLDRLRTLLSQRPGERCAQVYLNMALARELENRGDYAQAFEHLVRAKEGARRERRIDAHRDEALFASLMRAFPPALPGPPGDPSDAPIFIVGMPRTGTTLVERILSSHPDVQAAGELQDFAIALQRLAGGPEPILFSPDLVCRVQAIDWAQLGAAYLSAAHQRVAGAPRFTDKLPHNFLYAGFIAHALPRARIVCVRRNPMDTCLSNFRQLFEDTSVHFDYSFDLLATGRYYLLFDRLMAHWRDVLPGRVLEVAYEDLIGTPEPVTRRLLEFCGLAWDEACLASERNPSSVSTFSAAQVREPVHPRAVGRWRNYEPQLSDLRALLAEAGVWPEVAPAGAGAIP